MSKWKKPFVLDLKESVCRCDEMYAFASSPYTRGSVEIPFAMCKPHQEEFATLHQDTDNVMQKAMITYFEG